MATYAQLFYPALSGLQFDGVALASGVVYFYEPGTTTNRTIYTNRTKTVTAANPYTLDSNGQAEIFLDGVYDIVVKTAVGGTTKATWENYEAGFTLDGFTASTTPTANQIPALNSSSVLTLPNAVHVINGNKIWHEGNDGASSGLDADKLDGQEGAYYAPLASPTFTGVPAAPTAAAGTNTTQLATTAFAMSNGIIGYTSTSTSSLQVITASSIPTDDTKPQVSEGTLVMSVAYAAKKSTSKIRVTAHIWGYVNGGSYLTLALFQSGSSDSIGAIASSIGANEFGSPTVTAEFLPATTSSLTYYLRVGINANTFYLNGDSTAGGSRRFGGAGATYMYIEEIAQ